MLLGGIIVYFALPATVSIAQQDAELDALEEIIVTAQRREQNLMDVLFQ